MLVNVYFFPYVVLILMVKHFMMFRFSFTDHLFLWLPKFHEAEYDTPAAMETLNLANP